MHRPRAPVRGVDRNDATQQALGACQIASRAERAGALEAAARVGLSLLWREVPHGRGRGRAGQQGQHEDPGPGRAWATEVRAHNGRERLPVRAVK